MLYFEKYKMPAANLGEENPFPDIHNIEYIHASFQVSKNVTDEDQKYMGKGKISTILPYKIQDDYDRNRTVKEFDAAVLENDYLRAVFLSQLGGRLWSLFDKTENRELLYVNSVFQPANLALRNAWYSGGVEFNRVSRGIILSPALLVCRTGGI